MNEREAAALATAMAACFPREYAYIDRRPVKVCALCGAIVAATHDPSYPDGLSLHAEFHRRVNDPVLIPARFVPW